MAKLSKLSKDFSVVPNSWLRDKELSLKAKGMLCMLQSVPDGWDFNISGLAKVSKDGIDSVKSCIEELKNAGYITWERERNQKGQFDVVVKLHEERKPQGKNHSGKSTVENPTQYNKEIKDLNRNISTNVDILAKPQEKCLAKEQYGNQQINEAFDLWEKELGYKLKQSQINRRACWNMLRAKDKGEQWLRQMLVLLKEANKDKYSGIRIANFADLQRDWEKLMSWGSSKYEQSQEDKKFDSLLAEL